MACFLDARRLIKRCVLAACAVACAAACGCDSGDDTESELATWRGEPPLPPPGCVAVCQHITGACDASVDGCLEQCALFFPSSDACADLHEAYLECMKTVEVSCHWAAIETIGCDEEREILRSCGGR